MPEPHAERIPDFDSLLQLAEALVDGHRVALSYRDAGDHVTVRAVEPLALTYLGGHWSLTAWCHLRDAFRTFRVGRVEGIRDLGLSVAPGALPAGFDPRRAASASYLQPGPKAQPLRATVRLTGRLLPLGLAFFPQALCEFPAADTTLCHLLATDLWALAKLVAGFASGAESVHPAKGAEFMAQLRTIPF